MPAVLKIASPDAPTLPPAPMARANTGLHLITEMRRLTPRGAPQPYRSQANLKLAREIVADYGMADAMELLRAAARLAEHDAEQRRWWSLRSVFRGSSSEVWQAKIADFEQRQAEASKRAVALDREEQRREQEVAAKAAALASPSDPKLRALVQDSAGALGVSEVQLDMWGKE